MTEISDILSMRVGRNLKALRQARGLSQEALAEILDVHRTYVGGLERGERNPSLQVIERIASDMGIDPFDLLQPERSLDPVVRAALDGSDPGPDARLLPPTKPRP